MDFNSVVLVGRLARDPVLRYAPNGAPVCSFTLSTSRRWTNADGRRVEGTVILEVDVWKRMAEISAQFLKKGRQVLVLGTLRQSRWVDPKTGEPRSKTKVVGQQVQFLGRKTGEDSAQEHCPSDTEDSDE